MAAPTNAALVKKVLANSEPSTHGPLQPWRDVGYLVANGGAVSPVDATRGQLAINNDDGLPNARPNAFSESLRNQLSHNVIFSAALVPPRNH